MGEHGEDLWGGKAKGGVDVLHMERGNSGAQEAPTSPDVAKIKHPFCCFLWIEHSSWLKAHLDVV